MPHRKRWSLFVLTLCAMGLSFGTAVAADKSPPSDACPAHGGVLLLEPKDMGRIGGPGGDHDFRQEAKDGEAILGLTVWRGDRTDKGGEPGQVNAVKSHLGRLNCDGSIEGIYATKKDGDSGGYPRDAAPAGYVLVGVEARVGTVVDRLKLRFQRWGKKGLVKDDYYAPPIEIGGIGGNPGWKTLQCPPETVVVRVYGRYGIRLDSIGIVCAKPDAKPKP